MRGQFRRIVREIVGVILAVLIRKQEHQGSALATDLSRPRVHNSAFGHHPDQVSGTQLETQIPPDTKHNNFLIEMSSFEKSEAWRLGHLTIIARSPICFIVCTRTLNISR